MPSKLPTLCGSPRCPNLSISGNGYCRAHLEEKRRRDYQEDHRRRGSPSKQGYGTAHQRWRERVLRRDKVCKVCGISLATQADHRVPLAAGGAPLASENGQGLCASCHSKKTRKENRT